MVKNLLMLFFVCVIAFPTAALFGQAAPAQEKMDKMAKQDRWEGNIIRSSQDKSTLTVRKVGSSEEKTVPHDSRPPWGSQKHGRKKANDIDASQVKDGDRVICEVSWDEDGVLHATV